MQFMESISLRRENLTINVLPGVTKFNNHRENQLVVVTFYASLVIVVIHGSRSFLDSECGGAASDSNLWPFFSCLPKENRRGFRGPPKRWLLRYIPRFH